MLSSIYSALVQPYFDYCTFVWGICNKFLATKLQKRQNRAARILTFSPYDASVDNLFTSFAWKKLEAHCKIQTASMVYKSLNGLALQYSNSLFPIVMKSLVSLSGIPRASYIAIALPLNNYVKNSFSSRGSVLWNSLPIELRQEQTLSAFKHGCSDLF